MKGIDLLGLGHRLFPVKDCIDLIPAGTAIGCFFNTFGDVTPNLKKMLESGKFPAVRIHLWWSNSHVIAPMSAVKKGAIHSQGMAELFPAVKFYVSHSCEHYEKNKAAVKKRIDLIKKHAPSVVPVDCSSVGRSLRVITESHPHENGTPLPTPFIVSNDGRDIFEMNAKGFLRAYKTAEILFLWTSRFNLRDPGEAPPPPKDRRKIPSRETIRKVCSLLKG